MLVVVGAGSAADRPSRVVVFVYGVERHKLLPSSLETRVDIASRFSTLQQVYIHASKKDNESPVTSERHRHHNFLIYKN